MKIRNLYQPFETEFWETNEYTGREYKKTFFEMVFILQGKGTQLINGHQLPYTADKLFLIFPQDVHGFEVHSSTQFFFIRFNESYLSESYMTTQPKEWLRKVEFIFHSYDHVPGCILKNVPDKALIRSMVEALIREQQNEYPHSQEVIQQIINTIITIVARNIPLTQIIPAGTPMPQSALSLLSYIHQNIYFPEQLKAEKIAATFNVSPTYISEYFKNQVGESLQQYIINYKLLLIETRLSHTNVQVNELVSEFGFTDASHLNRLFKKYKGMSPSEYRKSKAG